ncbi:MAG: NTP transferase domain-containing protein [Microbacterium sp.]|uniref:nucleotidyltransferase family protein n=1 Tax=Microbacterium sp. TaxID=51671 RepID=UPI001AD382DF|nr:NTP transferase domain-containing protein [Microbacterium sp.]MBN9176758.1 NTP transferase domain-containing protein [Microbacterium sp.]
MSGLCGIVLAAGAGTRYGGPKALAFEPAEAAGPRGPAADPAPRSWLLRAVAALHAGGCQTVLVGLGAEAAAAEAILRDAGADAEVVTVADWGEGVAATVRATLRRAAQTPAAVAVLVTVDTPELPAAAVARVAAGAGVETIARASYGGSPGHPVVVGRAHWEGVIAAVRGDRGAGVYLAARGARAVPCDDLWSGADRDTRAGV